MSLTGVRADVAANIEYLQQLIAFQGGQARITSGVRTRGEQARLYRRYKLGLSPFPAAPPGQSKHEYGLAVDLAIEPAGLYNQAAAYWLRQGGSWFPSDYIHFEAP